MFLRETIFQPHKLPLSSSLLGKGMSCPQLSHCPVWAVCLHPEKPGNPISPCHVSQQKTPPATQITQPMYRGQPRGAVLPTKRLNVQLATHASCCYRKRVSWTPPSYTQMPIADPSPLHRPLCLCPIHRPHLCYISQGTCTHMCIHIYGLCTASNRILQWSLPWLEY